MGDDHETEKLTAAMAAGDENAVESFYRQYFDWLYAQARRVTGRDEAFCLDVVQDAVLRVIRTVRGVGSHAQFRAWLRLVIRTTALDLFRAEKRREKREAFVVELQSCDDFPYGLFDDEQHEWVRKQVEKFDPELVQMIELRFEQHWTLARIGELLGLSTGTIDGRLRRAIEELRQRASEEFDDE